MHGCLMRIVTKLSQHIMIIALFEYPAQLLMLSGRKGKVSDSVRPMGSVFRFRSRLVAREKLEWM